jgi:hypothetical protein
MNQICLAAIQEVQWRRKRRLNQRDDEGVGYLRISSKSKNKELDFG